MRVLTIGGASQDIIIEYANPETVNINTAKGTRSYMMLEEGKKIEVNHLGFFTGGGATNSAVAFKRLGFDVSAFCRVGDDDAGRFIVSDLQKMGVTTDLITHDPEEHTGTSFIIPSLKGDRTILAYRGVNEALSRAEIPWSAIESCDQLYITSLSGPSAEQLPEIVRYAKKHQIPVAVNPGISQLKLGGAFLKHALSDIDILIFNSSEAKQFMVSLIETDENIEAKLKNHVKKSQSQLPELLNNSMTHQEVTFHLKDFMLEVLRQGPKIIAVTHGDGGVYVADHTHLFYHRSVPVEVCNTLGAGDAFGSGFVAALLQGHSMNDAIRWGVINSASVISFRDAKTGLLTQDEIIERHKNCESHWLQNFKLNDFS